MIMVTLIDCSPKVRGGSSKWLLEISTGVYIGSLNTRMRDELWGRICEHLRDSKAAMAYSSSGEQRLDSAIHNTNWSPVDYDGTKLMKKPGVKKRKRNSKQVKTEKAAVNRAEKFYQVQRVQEHQARKRSTAEYIVLDAEATGLNIIYNRMTEVMAIRIKEGREASCYDNLVYCDTVPETVVELTGITSDKLKNEGRPIAQVLKELLGFIGDIRIVSHDANFD